MYCGETKVIHTHESAPILHLRRRHACQFCDVMTPSAKHVGTLYGCQRSVLAVSGVGVYGPSELAAQSLELVLSL